MPKEVNNTVPIAPIPYFSSEASSKTLPIMQMSTNSLLPEPEFVSPDQIIDYKCVFCYKVAVVEPYQALICACRMCRSCVMDYLETCEKDGELPYCKGNTPDCKAEILSLSDKKKNRVVRDQAATNDLRMQNVYCPNKIAGCEWIGEWSDSKKHVEDYCMWAYVPCQDCGSPVRKNELDDHLTNDCPKRLSTCEYCSKSLQFEDLLNHYDTECEKNFDVCQECGTNIRQHLKEKHLQYDCEKRVVKCDFAHFGCTVEGARAELSKHYETWQNKHLKMAAATIELLKLQINELQSNLDTASNQITRGEPQLLRNTSFNGIFIWKVQNFKIAREIAQTDDKHFVESPVFFTSSFGYKLKLRLYPNGEGTSRGTHLCLNLVVLEGEYDDILQWPFTSKVTFTLLDQNRSKPKPYSDTFQPSVSKPTSEIPCLSRVSPLASLSVLDSKSDYLVNDTLYIKVVVDASDVHYP